MDGFLAEGLLKLASLTAAQRTQQQIMFDHAMILNRRMFGDHAFRKSLASTDPSPSRSVINISLFEVCATTMADVNVAAGSATERRLRSAVVSLLRDDDFSRAITYSTNSTIAVHKRFADMESAVITAAGR